MRYNIVTMEDVKEKLESYSKLDVRRLVAKLPQTYAQDVRKKVEQEYGASYSVQTIYNTLFGRTKPKQEVFDALLEYAAEVAEQRKETAERLKSLFKM